MRDVHVLVIPDRSMQSLGNKASRESSASLTCQECQKTFTRSWLLKNHQRVHTGERPYKCAFCDKAFADKSNLRQHQKIHTTTEKLFQCGICCRTFAQRRYLMKHATEIHRDVSMSFVGSHGVDKKGKVSEQLKLEAASEVNEKTDSEPSVESGSQTGGHSSADVPDRSADHQYMTRKKTRIKTDGEDTEQVSKPVEEPKLKQYSEQDLKDFIKSNQRTMEKNGYIFIKQNFESLDTEPKLTEISEVPVKAVKDELELKADGDTGNQILNINGKMVYLQMGGKPVTVFPNKHHTISASKSVTSTTESSKLTTVSAVLKGRKLIAKKDTGHRRHGSALKSGSARKGAETSSAPVGNVKFLTLPSVKQTNIRPLQVIPALPQRENQTILPLLPLGAMPLVSGPSPVVIPVSYVQVSQFNQSILVPAGMTSNVLSASVPNITPVSISNVAMTSPDKTSQVSPVYFSPDNLKVIELPKGAITDIDEKGAAGEMTETQIVTSTPIVSDANWQSIVNINSEQELLEFINSQQVTSVDTDHGMTILIQNVESQNPSVMSEIQESQSLLTGSGNFSSVFPDQSSIISDQSEIIPEVLPDTDHINDGHINTEDNSCNNLVIVKEELHHSDHNNAIADTNSHPIDGKNDLRNFSDKMNVDSEGTHGHFSDHSLYTINTGTYEIDEKVGELMETSNNHYQPMDEEYETSRLEAVEEFRERSESCDQPDLTIKPETIPLDDKTSEQIVAGDKVIEGPETNNAYSEADVGAVKDDSNLCKIEDPDRLEVELENK